MPAITMQPSSAPYQISSTTLDDKDFYENAIARPDKYTWVHRFLGILCGKTSHENVLSTSGKNIQYGIEV